MITVAIAFFIEELGDKTQLATIALAAKFSENPIGILMGTTLGRLIADAIGIVVGVIMCNKIPQKKIKLISAGAFAIFGRKDVNKSVDKAVVIVDNLRKKS